MREGNLNTRKIFYNNPAIFFTSLLKASFSFVAEDKLIEYFRAYTGKKYILLTSSARSALYLGYKSLGHRKVVLTSPLTCSVAITPIVEADHEVRFMDLEEGKLAPDYNTIEFDDSKDFIDAVQVIHIGGLRCNIEKLGVKCLEHNKFLIEDCAQSFNPLLNPSDKHQYSDIVCYSLIKNFFGLSGGVLATNDEKIFNTAKETQDKFPLSGLKLNLYRIVKGVLTTYRAFWLTDKVLVRLIDSIEKVKKIKENNTLRKELIRPSPFTIKFATAQLGRLPNLNKRRIKVAKHMKQVFSKMGLENSPSEEIVTSFVKFYYWDSKLKSKLVIDKFAAEGLECKHLSENFIPKYQPMLVGNPEIKNSQNPEDLPNYLKIHDSILTLPLRFDMQIEEVNYIANRLYTLLNE